MEDLLRRDLCNRIERLLDRREDLPQYEVVQPEPEVDRHGQLMISVPGVPREDYDGMASLLAEALTLLRT